jgi:hypothetical protein
VILNEGQAGRTEVPAGTLGGPGVDLPVLAASFKLGRRLAQAGPGPAGAAPHRAESTGRPTSNVLVELPGADPGRVVMAGAHLDSVPASPRRRRGAPADSAAIDRVLTGYLRGRGLAVGETSLRAAPTTRRSPPPASRWAAVHRHRRGQERSGPSGVRRDHRPGRPGYHARCDNLDNPNLGVLDQMADAAATAVATFARDPGPVDRAG